MTELRCDSSPASGDPTVDAGLSAFERARPRLFGIAYRMLGSVEEAEDVVQDAWTRWQTTHRADVRDPAAFLATTTTRLAINVLKSARTRRETYAGAWLTEPIDTSADPTAGAERDEALELAVLVLIERLTPTERAAFVLREAFDYPYREIAQVLRVEEPNARQLVTRARQHVAEGRRTRPSHTDDGSLLQAIVSAAQSGDVGELERLFQPRAPRLDVDRTRAAVERARAVVRGHEPSWRDSSLVGRRPRCRSAATTVAA